MVTKKLTLFTPIAQIGSLYSLLPAHYPHKGLNLVAKCCTLRTQAVGRIAVSMHAS